MSPPPVYAREGSSDPSLSALSGETLCDRVGALDGDLKLGHLSPGPYLGVGDKCTNYRLCQMFPPRSEGGDICHNLTILFEQETSGRVAVEQY